MTETLNNICLDQEVIVKQIKGDGMLKRRLMDLGFIPEASLKCILISPFKDPKAYRINNNTIALRNIDAQNIEVVYANN